MDQKQKFDISIDRVEKIPVPLLVVGLGGTGCDVLRTIKETFAERYVLPKDKKGQDLPAPNKTAYLGIDSRGQRPDGLEVSEYVDISLDGIDKILADQDKLLSPYEKTWVNRDLRHSTSHAGMGTIRQAARLALSRNYGKVNQAIKGAIQNIVAKELGGVEGPVHSVEIVVITGLGGGTGSGIFLDMCQILRDTARTGTVIPAKITGYLVMPDVSLMNVSAASGMEGPIKHNAYAALKELDYWMRVRQHETVYRMEYGKSEATIEWHEPPFDYCILMSSSNVGGVPYKDGYMAVRNTIAENLMHYMADEDDVQTEYSYKQYEDNLSAIKITKTYPLYYGYRAIGSFTKRIPKKSILYYEGSLLFDTFIPLRDDSGKLQPDRRMFTDGQGKVRAETITGNGKQLLQDFKTNVCKLPNFCGVDVTDKVKVASVQNLNPPPHNKWHNWRNTVCAPVALDTSRTYLDKAWGRFEDFARSVITDPEQGPFALQAYLDAQDGLISYMEEILANWKSRHHTLRNQSIAQSEENCNTAWPSFRNPPMMGRKGALEQYKHALQTLYTYVTDCEFLETHIESLEKLILRVKEYLRDGLKPLCASIEFLEREFKKQQQDDSTLVQDIYNLETVQQSIDDAFKDANAEQRVSCQFLDKITAISLETQPNVDAKTSGVEFICRGIGLQEMCEVLQKDLEAVYGEVNNQSLDDIMEANVGEDVAAQQRWMDDLANSVLNSSLPMFLQDAVFTSDSKAPYSYMSIPQNAKTHLTYIKEAFANHDPGVEPKPSYLTDHIYALTAWDKLPLYRYGRMEELRRQYDEDLNTEYGHGLHLVRTGNGEDDYRSNWSLLPSPKPSFLFSVQSVHSEKVQYEQVQELVKRGMACGMIEVQDDQPRVKADVHMLYADGTALMSNEYIQQKKDEILKEKNPATGEAYADSVIAEKLLGFLQTAQTVTLKENEVSPSHLAGVLKLDNQPCDPFADNIQGDLVKMKTAKENYKKLCVTMTEAMVYGRPDLVWALKTQLAAYEDVYAEYKRRKEAKQIWEKRLEYAETAAEIFMYLDDIIFLGANGLKYKDKGQKYDIITERLLADDLKDCEPNLIKAAAFLSDTLDDNAAKADLSRMMTAKRREFTESIDDETLTLDEMNEIIEATTNLRDELKSDQETLEHAMRVNPSQRDQLEPQATMAEMMRKFMDSKLKNFKKIAKGLE